ncbi:MAG: TPM domain-containing protein, partial [Bacteroidales bacterium]|nr:TPM domain-containing protein [Bacteroidales bacterium]
MTHKSIYITLAFVAALTLSSCDDAFEKGKSAHYDVTGVPNPRTTNANAFVSNPDGILSIETVRLLNAQFFELENETGAQVALVALNSIGYQDIDDFANKLFNHWGIGQAGLDNGVLILFVLDQKAIRFEIGYGLEGALPDAICKRIQTQVMLPEFRKEHYDAGMVAGVEMVIRIIKEEPVPELAPVLKVWLFVLCATVLVAVFGPLRFYMMRRSMRRMIEYERKKHGNFAAVATQYESNFFRYSSFKSDRNYSLGCSLFFMIPILGYLLFGTGLLPWQFLTLLLAPIIGVVVPVNIWARRTMNKIRRTPIRCSGCGGTMNMLPVARNLQSLSASQQFEKRLNSMDYDVFKCEKCQKEMVFPVKYAPTNNYSVCSKCGTRAFRKKQQKTIQSATTKSSGIKEVTYLCLFCQHTETKRVTIPRIDLSSGSSSSRGGSLGG